MLQVNDVTVRFGEKAALSHIDIEVADGETVAVMGPSGCGKSTLLRVIAGLETPVTGDVRWNGADLASVPVHRRGFGLMFQDYSLFPHRTVEQNVAFGVKMAGAGPGDLAARTKRMLEIVGLEDLAQRSILDLSGGEQQRVALARTLAPSPRLLMLDEPIGALDRTLRDRLIPEFRSIFSLLDVTAIYVTHDQDEAFAVADRVAVMEGGSIVRIGAPHEIWRDPQTEFVARFLGFEDRCPATVDAGTLHLPWGSFPFDAPDGGWIAVVLPGGAALDTGGELSGSVEDMVYAEGSYRTRVRLDSGVTVHAQSRVRPGIGDRVSLEIDPASVVLVAPAAGGADEDAPS